MKLPVGKREKTMLFAFAGILVVAAIYAAIQFGIGPQLTKYKKAKAEKEDLAGKIDEAWKEIKKQQQLRDENEVVKKELREIDEKYIMRPVFGNYRYEAEKVIKGIASNVNVKIASSSEVWPPEKAPAKQQKSQFSAYTIKVSAFLSYEETISYLTALQAENPYITVWELDVTPLDKGPQSVAPRHQVSFSVTWPIWNEDMKEADVKKMFAPEEERADDGAGADGKKGNGKT